MRMTSKIAYALGMDAGNKSARAAGRTAWNEDDFNAASAATIRALTLIDPSATCAAAKGLDL